MKIYFSFKFYFIIFLLLRHTNLYSPSFIVLSETVCFFWSKNFIYVMWSMIFYGTLKRLMFWTIQPCMGQKSACSGRQLNGVETKSYTWKLPTSLVSVPLFIDEETEAQVRKKKIYLRVYGICVLPQKLSSSESDCVLTYLWLCNSYTFQNIWLNKRLSTHTQK